MQNSDVHHALSTLWEWHAGQGGRKRSTRYFSKDTDRSLELLHSIAKNRPQKPQAPTNPAFASCLLFSPGAHLPPFSLAACSTQRRDAELAVVAVAVAVTVVVCVTNALVGLVCTSL